jgi:hypothetical protein
LIRLIYVSQRIDDTDVLGLSSEFKTICEQAERNNVRDDITGFLICTPQWYGQILEGSAIAIERVMEKIKRDPRHFNITVLHKAEITHRMFSRWGMQWQHRNIANRILFLEENLVQDSRPDVSKTKNLESLAQKLADTSQYTLNQYAG